MSADHHQYQDLTFERFRDRARDDSLSKYERIGFPDEYRKGFEQAIFQDIVTKLGNLQIANSTVLDIGPGASDLPLMLIEQCRSTGSRLVLVDSKEMLDLLPEDPFISKLHGRFPEELGSTLDDLKGKVDTIISYSVFQYVFRESNPYRFVDVALSLLAPGGQMLLGDIPNISRRKRFFASDNGTAFHKQFMNVDTAPLVQFNVQEHNSIDDAVLLGVVLRARASGFDAFLLPQPPCLPMANRREDLVFIRP